MNIDPSILAAAIAAGVALIGYLSAQRRNRIEQRTVVFAQAMRAVAQVQEMPYLIWRRADSSPERIEALGQQQSARLQDVRYYANLIHIEHLEVAKAYHLLSRRARQQMHRNREIAWRDPLIGSSRNLSDYPPFRHDVGPELLLCIESMRAANRWFPQFGHRSIRRRRELLEQRDNLGQPADEWFVPLERVHW